MFRYHGNAEWMPGIGQPVAESGGEGWSGAVKLLLFVAACGASFAMGVSSGKRRATIMRERDDEFAEAGLEEMRRRGML